MNTITHTTPIGRLIFCSLNKKTKAGTYLVKLAIDTNQHTEFANELRKLYGAYDSRFMTMEGDHLILHASSIKAPRVSLCNSSGELEYSSLIPDFAANTPASLTFSTKLIGTTKVVADLVSLEVVDLAQN